MARRARSHFSFVSHDEEPVLELGKRQCRKRGRVVEDDRHPIEGDGLERDHRADADERIGRDQVIVDVVSGSISIAGQCTEACKRALVSAG